MKKAGLKMCPVQLYQQQSEASLLDNFCYAMKNMPEMEERPQELKGFSDLLTNSKTEGIRKVHGERTNVGAGHH